MFIVTEKVQFDASRHHTPGTRCEGCFRTRRYEVEVVLRAHEVGQNGAVVEASELKGFVEYVRSRCDLRHLNNEFSFPPTAENLARHFFEWIEGTRDWPLVAVRVSEEGRSAEYGRAVPHTIKVVVGDFRERTSEQFRLTASQRQIARSLKP